MYVNWENVFFRSLLQKKPMMRIGWASDEPGFFGLGDDFLIKIFANLDEDIGHIISKSKAELLDVFWGRSGLCKILQIVTSAG